VSAVPTPSDAEIVLWPGPRVDWLTQHARDVLTSCDWNVRAESDRIGLRLAGPALVRRPGELPSEGVVEGAVQLPPDGQPIVMLADHPTTGGYPVVAVVDPDHLWLVAQRPVGSVVRFRWHTGRPGR
jgi:allophanate hydrolase subunit 2